jgi:hypothetical protein
MNVIKSTPNALYVSEFMSELPAGILNKKSCGCGATSVALEDKHPTILAVPLKKLITNKVAQYPNERSSSVVLGVDGETTNDEILKYLATTSIPKIMVTYDSVPRLLNFLDSTAYRVVVDEYQELLKAYGYRDKAIINLLKAVRKHPYVTFLSATPIKPEYTPTELRNLPYTEIEWQSTTTIKPIRRKTNKPYNAIVNIIKQYKKDGYIELNGFKSYEAYFFVNSVKGIKEIIDNADLTQNQVKVICADTSNNRKTLGDFEINEVLDPNKMFTFVTSAAFIGADFYSDSGICYIVTNYTSKNTLLDMDSDIFQICGRIRSINNPFKSVLFHIYSTSVAALSVDEFEEALEGRKQKTKQAISSYAKLDDSEKIWLQSKIEADIKGEIDYAIFNEETQEVEFNEFKYLNDKFRFDVINHIYKNGLSIRDAYIKAGFDVSESQQYENYCDTFISTSTKKETFRDCAEEYCDLKDNGSLFNFMTSERINEIEVMFPTIKKAYEEIGTNEMRANGYHQTKIANYITANSTEAKNAIYFNLCKHFEVGKRYTSKEIKATMQNTYNRLEVKATAKAKDIETYFDVKAVKIGSDNGSEIIKAK